MKYGDTLRQRSTPEWGHFNIDYDYLKDLIKHQTTSGTGKALSIPGQGESSEKAFSDTFYRALKAQHDRINLFIRSKSGEIERRLDHIHKSLEKLQLQHSSGPRLPSRLAEKYAKINADVTKVGEEIRSLSRFQVAQRTGFRKILKKYKRWTKDAELERDLKQRVTSSPTSFYQLDLGNLLDQYIDVLGALRAPFDAADASDPSIGSKPSSPSARISRACQNGSDVDFDLVLALTPLGARGSKATYWIHPDHIVEAEVLLLQNMRLLAGSTPPGTRTSPEATPKRRKSSSTVDKFLGSEDSVGLLVLDHPESFAIKQNASSLGSGEDTAGTCQVKAAGTARWTTSRNAAIAINLDGSIENIVTAKLERKHLPGFLDASVPLAELSLSPKQDASESNTATSAKLSSARQWLESHTEVRPIVGVCSKRTRFVSLHNNNVGGMWATLDRDVIMKSSLHKDLNTDEWYSVSQTGAIRFPHAILEIRKEGTHSSALMQALDRSHLVERVRGFSLEAQAVWACCRPNAMSAPFWVSMLDNDIRKLPPATKRRPRKANNTVDSFHVSPPATSGSGGSNTDGQISPFTPRYGESSATSGPEFVEAPPLRAFRKKQNPYAECAAPIESAEPETQRYWNEYDNPESEDEGYYIYVDPDAVLKFPGQELFRAWAAKVRRIFGIKEAFQEDSSLSIAESSDDETSNGSPVLTPKAYGTFGSKSADGYFNGLFRTLRDAPHDDIEAFNSIRRQNARERRSLLTAIEAREHHAEMTKLYFYTACLAMAVVIDVILTTMTMTSRRKERGVVDSVVLFGTICNLLLGVMAIISMQTRREQLGWVHKGIVFLVFAGNIAVDSMFFVWVFGEL